MSNNQSINHEVKAMKIIKNTATNSAVNRSMVQMPMSVEPRYLRPKGNKIALPTMDGISFEKIEHIISLEAQGNYTTIHFLDGRNTLVCKTLPRYGTIN